MACSVLITRPRPAAEEFAGDARARLGDDMRIIVSPLLRIVPLPEAAADLSGVGTLVLTSAHAVPAAAAGAVRDLPCYCVGPATAAAARAAGLAPADGGGTAETLLARIAEDAPPGPLLYLRGEHVAADLAGMLRSAGFEARELVVYRQVAEPLSDEARALLGDKSPVILPLFSLRTARLFAASAKPAAPLWVAAISRNVADCLPPGWAEALIVAESPTADAVLDAMEALASRAKRVESGYRAK